MTTQRRALLVIDPQKVYTTEGSELFCRDWAGTIDRINALTKAFKDKKLPIILVRHIHKTDGSDLGRMFDYLGEEPDDFNFKEGTPEIEYEERLQLPDSFAEITKNRYSAFIRTQLRDELKKLRVTDLVITGFMTNFCCESTARDAHDLDYYVDFIADATGTPGTESMDEQQVRSAVSDFMASGFARVASTHDFLRGL